MKVHDLKCWPEPYDGLRWGRKTWELRKDDRGYAVGDILVLREWLQTEQEYTGSAVARRVTYLMRGPAFGLPDGYVIMSVEPLEIE